jgi:ribosomal protein L7/L12
VPVPQVPLDGAAVRDISDLLARDRTIEAIKRLREATGAGLREAKERVEAWDVSATTPPATTSPGLDDLAVEARQVRDASGAIHAIKLVRERTGWGLAEAKKCVERLG